MQKSAYELLNRLCIPADLFSCCKDGAEVCLPLAVATSCCARETESSLALAAISSSGSCSGCAYTPHLGCAINAAWLSSKAQTRLLQQCSSSTLHWFSLSQTPKLERLCGANYLVGKCAHVCLGGRCTWCEVYAYVDLNCSKVKCIDTTAAHRLMSMVCSNKLVAIIVFKHQWAMSLTVLPLFSRH